MSRGAHRLFEHRILDILYVHVKESMDWPVLVGLSCSATASNGVLRVNISPCIVTKKCEGLLNALHVDVCP